MSANGRRISQQEAIAELARKYLGPFSGSVERQHWEWVIGDLVSCTRIDAPPPSAREIAGLFSQLARTGERFRRALRSAHPLVKYGLLRTSNIDAVEVADEIKGYLAAMRGLESLMEESAALAQKQGRSQAWLVLKKEHLLEDAQGVLEERCRPHGLTRHGHLARFAAEIWNCANGTTVGADAFSYAIDHLQKTQRSQRAHLAGILASARPRNPAVLKTRMTKRSDNPI